MPRYNRKSRWNTERAVQGAASGAAYGFSVGGGPGAAVGAVGGGIIGGLTGRDTSVNRAPYDEAIRQFSYRRRGQARVAADEGSARAGASFTSRGLNTSELAAGVISANRGRYMRAAEDDISQFSADIEFRIADAERQAMIADDEETRQGWLDLAEQLGTQALTGDFTPKQEIDRDMVASLRKRDPQSVQRWLSGRMSDEEFLGVYKRYNQIYGEPGTLDRRFSDLEEGTRGPVPDTLPVDLKNKYSGTHLAIRNMKVPLGPPAVPLVKDAAQLTDADEELPKKVRETKQELYAVHSQDDIDTLNLAFPNGELNKLLGYDIEGLQERQQKEYEGGLDERLRSEDSPKRLPTIEEERPNRLPSVERERIDSPSVDAPWWNADFLSQQSNDDLLGDWNSMQRILNDPNASETRKQRAAVQLDLIKEVYAERIGPRDRGSLGSAGVTEAWSRTRRQPQIIGPVRPRQSRWRGNRQIQPPPAERKGKPDASQPQADTSTGRYRRMESDDVRSKQTQMLNPPAERSVGRFRELEAETPPPPPNLDDVRVSKTPIKSIAQADTSTGRYRRMESDDVRSKQTPLITEANKWVGKMEDKDKTSLMKYFDAQGISYFGESVDPTKVFWCAVFLNAALIKSGYEPLKTETYAAREFMTYGTESTGNVGDIAVWKNHTGIVVQVGNKIKILGGNQKDGVTIADKDEIDKNADFLGYRKPTKLQR